MQKQATTERGAQSPQVVAFHRVATVLAALVGAEPSDVAWCANGDWSRYVLRGLKALPESVQTVLSHEVRNLHKTPWTAAVAALGKYQTLPDDLPDGWAALIFCPEQRLDALAADEDRLPEGARRVLAEPELVEMLRDDPEDWRDVWELATGH